METHMVWCDRVSGSSDACMQRCICGTSWETMFSGLDRYIYVPRAYMRTLLPRSSVVLYMVLPWCQATGIYAYSLALQYITGWMSTAARLDRAYDIWDTGRTYGQNVCLGNAEKKENSIWDTDLVDTGQPKLVFSKFEKKLLFQSFRFFL
jgi:hypothetical protein